MTAAILCIGTEITRGEITNTNATWLAERLTLLGIDVAAVDCTSDDRDRIVACLRRLAAEHGVVVCTGGLGPTSDDITTECVAILLGVPLERDDASLAAIRERMQRFGRRMSESNAKQADFPRGATILPNPVGTAPGLSVTIGDSLAFFMPGVPHEMKRMFVDHVVPAVSPRVRGGTHQIRLRTFGLPESTVADKLGGIEEEFGVVLGYRAHFPEIEVKVLARLAQGSPEEARSLARAGADEVSRRLGADFLYGEGEDTLASTVGMMLGERGLKLAVAEARTGGCVSSLLSESRAADCFLGGLLIGDDGSAAGRLGIGEELIRDRGLASAEVARALADGVRRFMLADVGLAVAVAPEHQAAEGASTGLVNIALVTPGGFTGRSRVYPSSLPFLQRLAAFSGIALLRSVLLHGMDS